MPDSLKKHFSKEAATNKLPAAELSNVPNELIEATPETTSDRSPTNFMCLSAEIRVQVYKEVIRSTEPDFIAIADSAGLISSSTGPNPSVTTVMKKHGLIIGYAVANSLETIFNLRLTCRLIKHELDYEIIQFSMRQVDEAISAAHHPAIHSIRAHYISRQHFKDTQPMLIVSPWPKTYHQIQNLQITTYAPKFHPSGDQADEELFFLNALPIYVRSVIFNTRLPKTLSTAITRDSTGEAIQTLIGRLFTAMRSKSWAYAHRKGKPLPETGVVEVQINLPVEMNGLQLRLWKHYERVGETAGLHVKQVKDHEGKVTGVVFGLARVTERKGVMGWTKDGLDRVGRWISG